MEAAVMAMTDDRESGWNKWLLLGVVLVGLPLLAMAVSSLFMGSQEKRSSQKPEGAAGTSPTPPGSGGDNNAPSGTTTSGAGTPATETAAPPTQTTTPPGATSTAPSGTARSSETAGSSASPSETERLATAGPSETGTPSGTAGPPRTASPSGTAGPPRTASPSETAGASETTSGTSHPGPGNAKPAATAKPTGTHGGDPSGSSPPTGTSPAAGGSDVPDGIVGTPAELPSGAAAPKKPGQTQTDYWSNKPPQRLRDQVLQDRRDSVRVPSQASIQLSGSEHKLLDLSPWGVRVGGRLPLGKRFDVGPHKLSGRVVWSSESESGLQFEAPSDDDQRGWFNELLSGAKFTDKHRQQRRQWTRAAMDAEATLEDDRDQSRPCRVKNLSVGGAWLELAASDAETVSNEERVRLILPAGKRTGALALAAVVAERRGNVVHLRFLTPTAGLRKRLEQFLAASLGLKIKDS